MMSLDEKKALISYRKQKAYDSLREAKAVAPIRILELGWQQALLCSFSYGFCSTLG